MAGRRTSLASLAGQKVDDVPGKSDPLLLSLPLGRMVPTRFNPRRRFGTDEELREFGEKLAREQLQPAVVVSKAAYLKLWPEEAEHVGDASYVIANGERRYRASRLVGRPVLEVVHKEDVASSRAAFLDAVQSENNDRENLDPIERALGIDIMVTQLGGAEQVAVYYRKTKGWVSQQRKLLKLVPALQDLVSAGEMPVRVARDIAGLPADVQVTAWEEEVERRRMEKEAGARLRAEAASRFTAVNQPPPAAPTPKPVLEDQPPRFTAVNPPPSAEPEPEPEPEARVDTAAADRRVPEQPSVPGVARADAEQFLPEQQGLPATTPGGPRMFPYDNGREAFWLLRKRMPVDQFCVTLRLMQEHAEKHGLDVQEQPAS